jgi:hypothetical protein
MKTNRKMKFSIKENGNLTIVDDNKETVIHSDRYDLKELMRTIQDYLNGNNIDEEPKPKVSFRYNPRSRRIEKIVE